MAIKVTILGSNSAIPAYNRNPTAQVVEVNNEQFLVDCGEATQIQMRKYGIKFQRITRIFISHLHGDHYFGLIGLLNTMHLLSREKELHIHAPKGLQEIIQIQLDVAHSKLRFPLHYHTIDTSTTKEIVDNKSVQVIVTPVNHRIECYGFVFKEKPKPQNLIKEAIAEYELSLEQILKVKAGEAIFDKTDNEINRKHLIKPTPKPSSYAFITDTKPYTKYFEAIKEVDLLYHESTFLNKEKKRAKETYHSTAEQAATVAKEQGCKKLIIGHFSTRYKELNRFLNEAKAVFENVELATEGSVFTA